MKNHTIPYTFLTGSYFMVINSIMGFEGFYLNKLGISDKTIGLLVALTGIMAVFFQPLAGRITDGSRKFDMRHVLVFIPVCLSVLGLCILFFHIKYLSVVLFCLMIVVVNLSSPMLNSLCMLIKNRGFKINYGIARGIGSVTYALTAFVIGYFSDDRYFGKDFIPWTVIATSGLVVITILPFLFEKALSKSKTVKLSESNKKNKVGLFEFLKTYPRFVCFALCFSLIFIAHNILCTFVYQLIEPMGCTSREVGIITGTAAAVELPAMFCFSLLLKKFSPAQLLKASGFFFLLKATFCLIGVAIGNIYVFFAGQFFQMFSYGLYGPASVYYANSVIPEECLASGQAVMTASNVLGSVLGSIIGGVFLELLGGTGMMAITVSLCFLGTLLVQFVLKDSSFLKKSRHI